jgi:ATP citrate (pro-S)-lyase
LVCVQHSPKLGRKSSSTDVTKSKDEGIDVGGDGASGAAPPLFTRSTKCIVWGMQQRAVQGTLDFDYVCSRKEPSVVAIVYPFV